MSQKEKKNTKDSIKNCPNTISQTGAQPQSLYTIFLFMTYFWDFGLFAIFFVFSFKKTQNKIK